MVFKRFLPHNKFKQNCIYIFILNSLSCKVFTLELNAMKNLKFLTLFTAVVLLIISCKVAEPLPIVDNSFSIIGRDTIKTRIETEFAKIKEHDPNGKRYISVGDTIVTYKTPKLHTPPIKDPDLSKIKNNDDPDLKGKPLRYVAIGGSLTAGVRDGGYFNEGIMTSYPNLIARQMKLKKFEQPLFDAQDYNGFGRKARTSFNPTGGPVPKFKDVENNTGTDGFVDITTPIGKSQSMIKLKKYKGKDEELDNLAIPELHQNGFSPTSSIEYITWLGGQSYGNAKAEFSNRMFEDKKKSIVAHALTKKMDFFTLEFGWVGLGERNLSMNTDAYDPKWIEDYSMGNFYLNPEVILLRKLRDSKVKYGVIYNIPNYRKFPYCTFINRDKVNAVLNQLGRRSYTDEYIFYPTSVVDSLLSPKVHIALKAELFDTSNPNPVLTNWAQSSSGFTPNRFENNELAFFNKEVAFISDYFKYPMVDLYTLFNQILAGKYVTDDGIRVDGTWPNGNFFSTDGYYPTPLGNAIITNETIKVFNKYYGTEIPLIPTREYLEK